MILASVERPLQARFAHVAAATNFLSFRNLDKGRAGIPDGEEQLWILSQTGSLVAPIH
jgi:hypothetical protein